MKAFLSLLAVIFSVQASANIYEIAVSGDLLTVNIGFKTAVDQSSSCPLTVSDLMLTAPQLSSNIGLPPTTVGSIFLQVEVAANARCTRFPAPHAGSISFDRGDQLPNLRDGYYLIHIDGEVYGYLKVTGGIVSLVTADQISL